MFFFSYLTDKRRFHALVCFIRLSKGYYHCDLLSISRHRLLNLPDTWRAKQRWRRVDLAFIGQAGKERPIYYRIQKIVCVLQDGRVENPKARSPRRINFVLWHVILVGCRYGTCAMSSFWLVKILRWLLDLWNTRRPQLNAKPRKLKCAWDFVKVLWHCKVH
jgi:hypothetical protein